MKRLLVNLLKVGVSAGLLTYLAWQARDSLGKLPSQPPDWGLLSLSAALCLLMVLATFVRWYLLVRALELPFRIRDALRLGFLGYMLNLVSPGSVGGDLFRAVFIAREHPGRRAEAVATVFIDRVIGLYALFVVGAAAVILNDLVHHPKESVRTISHLTLIGTAVSTFCGFIMLTPGFTHGRFSQSLGRLPRVGHVIRKLLGAVRMYREKLPVLILAGLMSLLVHFCSTVGIYLAAKGLPGESPDLGSHFLVVPLGMLVAAAPIFPGGVGGFEAMLEYMYVTLPAVAIEPGKGFVVGLAYRVITIGVAIIGFGYYLANRAIVRQIMRQASVEAEMEDVADADPMDADSAGGADSSRETAEETALSSHC